MDKIVDDAAEMAHAFHGGQFRRDGVTPYEKHLEAVAQMVERSGADDIYIAAAWLHDILEDTGCTREDLVMAHMPLSVIDAVESLTRQEGESYWKYLDRVWSNRIACYVKQADILHNLSEDPTPAQVKKYAAALTDLWFRQV